MELVSSSTTSEKKYKYYKISRSRSNTILEERPFDVYFQSALDSNLPSNISSNEYSIKYKHTTKPLVLEKENLNNCVNINDIRDTVNGIKKNIEDYAKENKFIQIILHYIDSDKQKYVTIYIIKKVQIREKKEGYVIVHSTDEKEFGENDSKEIEIEFYEPNTELPVIDFIEDSKGTKYYKEDEKYYVLKNEYTGYAMIENFGTELETLLIARRKIDDITTEILARIEEAYYAYKPDSFVKYEQSNIYIRLKNIDQEKVILNNNKYEFDFYLFNNEILDKNTDNEETNIANHNINERSKIGQGICQIENIFDVNEKNENDDNIRFKRIIIKTLYNTNSSLIGKFFSINESLSTRIFDTNAFLQLNKCYDFIIDKFSVLFVTDEYSYFDKTDNFLNSVAINKIKDEQL